MNIFKHRAKLVLQITLSIHHLNSAQASYWFDVFHTKLPVSVPIQHVCCGAQHVYHYPEFNICLQLGFQLGGGQGPACVFIQHQLPPPQCPSSTLQDESCVPVGKWVPRLSWPQRSVSDWNWKGLGITEGLTIQNRQAQTEGYLLASATIISALKEPHRDRAKQKIIKHSGAMAFDKIVNIAWEM